MFSLVSSLVIVCVVAPEALVLKRVAHCYAVSPMTLIPSILLSRKFYRRKWIPMSVLKMSRSADACWADLAAIRGTSFLKMLSDTSSNLSFFVTLSYFSVEFSMIYNTASMKGWKKESTI